MSTTVIVLCEWKSHSITVETGTKENREREGEKEKMKKEKKIVNRAPLAISNYYYHLINGFFVSDSDQMKLIMNNDYY